MAGAPAPAPGPRQPRRGPAPFASFDHDVSDESSPESKQTFQLPEIVEDRSASPGAALAPGEARGRSHSTPAAGALGAPAAPRIDISRASSSSHHDSRDSSPEMALFAGTAEDADTRGRLELGFREDGALELRSSTEELAFLEGAPGESKPAPAPAPPPPSASRRHSRKDSQGSEAALLAVSGRTSRLSSVGSQCSAHSALSGFSHASRVSRLSVVSGASRSPSPHKMLLETSFCGPKPIETDPEVCAAAVEERLLELVQRAAEPAVAPAPAPAPAAAPASAPANTRDRREVRTEVTVEPQGARPAARPAPRPASADPPVVVAITPAEEKRQKETRNRVRAARSKERSDPEVYRNRNRSKDIIRIKLKPDEEYEEDDDEESDHTLVAGEAPCKPATLELGPRRDERAPPSPTTSRRRTPSPSGAVSRKSSFCSLFKSRETIASPDSPSSALRRKKSLNEGRSRSKSRDCDRDRSTTPSSAGKIRGSVLSLFKTPRRNGASPSPSSRAGSRAGSPGPAPAPPPGPRRSVEKLKYYEDARDGVIHIPLRTPPDERPGSEPDSRPEPAPEPARPASAPQPARDRPEPPPTVSAVHAPKPVHRTVLPDGSIIIPLHSPTERTAPSPPAALAAEPAPASALVTPDSRRSVASPESRRSVVTSESRRSVASPESRRLDDSGNGDPRTESGSDEGRRAEPSPAPGAPASPPDDRARRKRRLVFTTHVGSREQVFSTQFSITKTPSVTSEISESAPGPTEPSPPEEARGAPLRDTHIAATSPPATRPASRGARARSPPDAARSPPEAARSPPDAARSPPEAARSPPDAARSPPDAARSPPDAARSPPDAARDSSESEGSSEAAPPTRGGSDVEQRGLVVQESFEDELPYVPTTLPLERSLALPMVPVRERGGVATAGTRRPRAPGAGAARAPPAPPPAPPAPPVAPAPEPAAGDKLRIKLPRRPRTASAAAPPRPDRPRTGSGGDGGRESLTNAKSEWIDFSEVPERRKQPKRIQTLPAAAAADATRDVVFSYVEPEECRCECHVATRNDDELPLLATPARRDHDLSSPEGCAAPPFVADFDLRPRPEEHLPPEPRVSPTRGARRH